MHVLASGSGTLLPSTAAQQPRQLWEGRADPIRNAVEGLDLTPSRTSIVRRNDGQMQAAVQAKSDFYSGDQQTADPLLTSVRIFSILATAQTLLT